MAAIVPGGRTEKRARELDQARQRGCDRRGSPDQAGLASQHHQTARRAHRAVNHTGGVETGARSLAPMPRPTQPTPDSRWSASESLPAPPAASDQRSWYSPKTASKTEGRMRLGNITNGSANTSSSVSSALAASAWVCGTASTIGSCDSESCASPSGAKPGACNRKPASTSP
jgi:hypothetical protein